MVCFHQSKSRRSSYLWMSYLRSRRPTRALYDAASTVNKIYPWFRMHFREYSPKESRKLVHNVGSSPKSVIDSSVECIIFYFMHSVDDVLLHIQIYGFPPLDMFKTNSLESDYLLMNIPGFTLKIELGKIGVRIPNVINVHFDSARQNRDIIITWMWIHMNRW